MAIFGKGYTLDKIEAKDIQGQRGSTRFNAVLLAVIAAYWTYELSKGSQQFVMTKDEKWKFSSEMVIEYPLR